MNKSRSVFINFSLILLLVANLTAQNNPIKIGVIGLTHGHVNSVFRSEEKGNINIVGIVESDKEVALKYSRKFGFSMSKVYNSIDEMIKFCHPEAVSAFGATYDHLHVVEKAAPLGIHVMVEKPLAVSLKHAKKMETLAEKYKIHLLTNYVINRYPSNHKANEFVSNDSIGAIRKVVFRDGHRGPKKIGVSSEFLNWLTDPVKNGGGAITDFGCYGVNLMTWLLKGEKPSSVTAVTQQLQSVNNPKVDDDAMIILNYDNANALILASWNWPIERKDMEIYGLKGALYAHNKNELRLLTLNTNKKRHTEKLYDYKKQINPREDPFVFFYDVITNKVILDPYAIPSLENNMIVMEVLDAAIKSSKLNKSVQVKK